MFLTSIWNLKHLISQQSILVIVYYLKLDYWTKEKAIHNLSSNGSCSINYDSGH